jgi:hypothetical protein
MGAFFAGRGRAPQKTGLSAPIFAPAGQKFRSYPLRCSKMASVPFLSFKFLQSKNLKVHPAGLPAGCFAKLQAWPPCRQAVLAQIRYRGAHKKCPVF